MNEATREFVVQWMNKANEDLLVVKKLTEFEMVALSSVCFHCQQAVEKYLKAYLISNGKEIKKTHNIEFLLSECEDFDSDFAGIDPKNLSDFGVEIRYPGDLYTPSEQEAKEYIEIAHLVEKVVNEKIKI
ncbi:MAG: HEPN domain-containing protein [Tangfeifania sp.]